jgi:hypothetical protein
MFEALQSTPDSTKILPSEGTWFPTDLQWRPFLAFDAPRDFEDARLYEIHWRGPNGSWKDYEAEPLGFYLRNNAISAYLPPGTARDIVEPALEEFAEAVLVIDFDAPDGHELADWEGLRERFFEDTGGWSYYADSLSPFFGVDWYQAVVHRQRELRISALFESLEPSLQEAQPILEYPNHIRLSDGNWDFDFAVPSVAAAERQNVTVATWLGPTSAYMTWSIQANEMGHVAFRFSLFNDVNMTGAPFALMSPKEWKAIAATALEEAGLPRPDFNQLWVDPRAGCAEETARNLYHPQVRENPNLLPASAR